MKLERVQVGFEFGFNEQGIPVSKPIFKDLLVESMKNMMLKSFRFWYYGIIFLFNAYSIIVTDNKYIACMHVVLLFAIADLLKKEYYRLNQLRYERAIQA